MSKSFEVFKTMVASTAHCEEYDFDAFRSFPEIFSCEDHGYGLSVYLGSADEDVEAFLSEIASVRISEGLKLLMLFAIANGCLWLKLDSDGPTYDNFPIYDW